MSGFDSGVLMALSLVLDILTEEEQKVNATESCLLVQAVLDYSSSVRDRIKAEMSAIKK